jgi:hypothetical protein
MEPKRPVFPNLQRRGYRQGESKTRSLASLARQPNFAAMQLDKLFSQS